jgi:hypothetical protein
MQNAKHSMMKAIQAPKTYQYLHELCQKTKKIHKPFHRRSTHLTVDCQCGQSSSGYRPNECAANSLMAEWPHLKINASTLDIWYKYFRERERRKCKKIHMKRLLCVEREDLSISRHIEPELISLRLISFT